MDALRATRDSMAEAGAYYRLFYDLMVMALRTDSTREQPTGNAPVA